jgi:hypothetical protein
MYGQLRADALYPAHGPLAAWPSGGGGPPPALAKTTATTRRYRPLNSLINAYTIGEVEVEVEVEVAR